jgi:exodeoxyribonuclease VII large subunit
MRFEPENGLEVRVRGRLSVYEPRGEYQIVVEVIEPVGVGALQLAFQQQVKRLAAEGLFDETRKRRLPLLPRRVGVVTSPVGAAVRDILQVLGRRNRGIDVLIAPVKVQGTGAAREIADAIRLLNKIGKKPGSEVDVIIVGRGGGSIEDLWAFNEEVVARAIFESEIPVVSAVGHETDHTVADFVADLRAPTPSAAAEIVAADSSDLAARVEGLRNALVRATNYYLFSRRSSLRGLIESRGFSETATAIVTLSAKRRELEQRAAAAMKDRITKSDSSFQNARRKIESTDFRALIAIKSARLASLEQRVHHGTQRRLESRQRDLAVTMSKLHMLSPLSVLGRGYVLVKDGSGALIPRAASVKPGQELKLRFEDGEVDCQAK